MNDISKDILYLSKKINDHVQQFPDTAAGMERLLPTIYDYMTPFKSIMDSTTKVQMDLLCQQYPGLYRFGKLLEMIAGGIAEGNIEVPKDH